MEERKRKRFLWGMLLAWMPAVPLIFYYLINLKGFSEQKATGLGAVAGGLAEVYLTFGLGLTLASEVVAIVLLLGAFSRGHSVRALFSVLSICLSGLVIFLFGLFLYLFFVRLPHTS